MYKLARIYVHNYAYSKIDIYATKIIILGIYSNVAFIQGNHDGVYHINMIHDLPISWARSATGRRSTLTNLKASNLISMMLLSQANNGASGKAATKMVMKPNCMTENMHV